MFQSEKLQIPLEHSVLEKIVWNLVGWRGLHAFRTNPCGWLIPANPRQVRANH
jgi:hypothetical protein